MQAAFHLFLLVHVLGSAAGAREPCSGKIVALVHRLSTRSASVIESEDNESSIVAGLEARSAPRAHGLWASLGRRRWPRCRCQRGARGLGRRGGVVRPVVAYRGLLSRPVAPGEMERSDAGEFEAIPHVALCFVVLACIQACGWRKGTDAPLSAGWGLSDFERGGTGPAGWILPSIACGVGVCPHSARLGSWSQATD